ncbi:MAG: hypothetical protein WD512_06145, partial [Candidatus Paceibacterota bacterium]
IQRFRNNNATGYLPQATFYDFSINNAKISGGSFYDRTINNSNIPFTNVSLSFYNQSSNNGFLLCSVNFDGQYMYEYVFNGENWWDYTIIYILPASNRGSISGASSFNGQSINFGTLYGGGHSFNGGAVNSGTITGGVSFGNSSINYCNLGTNISFTYSTNYGSINGNATFDGSSINYGTIARTGAFNNSSNEGSGSILESGSFSSYSYNYGTVNGFASFDSSYNYGGTINGKATFSNGSYNFGTVNGEAIFDESSCNYGTVMGLCSGCGC